MISLIKEIIAGLTSGNMEEFLGSLAVFFIIIVILMIIRKTNAAGKEE